MVNPGSTTVTTLLEIVLVLLVPFKDTVVAVCDIAFFANKEHNIINRSSGFFIVFILKFKGEKSLDITIEDIVSFIVTFVSVIFLVITGGIKSGANCQKHIS